MNDLRVVVVGPSCSGKSTFARALAHGRGCAFVELDELHWGPDWTPRPVAVFQRLAQEAVSGRQWVVAGNYEAVRPHLWSQATHIVWLNLSFPRVFLRGIRRSLRRALTREILYGGNRETLRRAFFSRESIPLWIITSYRQRRRVFSELRGSGEYCHLQWHEARSPREAAEILHRLRNAGPACSTDAPRTPVLK